MTTAEKSVYDKYHRLVFYVAIQLLEKFHLPSESKDDIAQQGFLGMFRALNNGYTVTPQLIRTCMNNAMRDAVAKERRYHNRFMACGEPIEATEHDDGSAMNEIENRQDVSNLMSHLPEEQQQVLTLTFFQGLTEAEAATSLRSTEAKISQLKAEALATLQDVVNKNTTSVL